MESFKQGIKSGEVKRADAMKVRIEDIHEEPGFNLRREGEDLDASIDALAAHIASGGMFPPLECRPRSEGGVYVVDGHRRRRALLKIADSIRDGAGELWVNVIAFNGNDADRTLRVITSAEGRTLSQLEIAEGYKRLTAFNWTPDQIAARVGKTRQHVDGLLILANANADVQAMVAAGEVSASAAIDVVRKKGEQAGEVLSGAVANAKAAGKAKATSGAIKGKPLPRALSDELANTVDRFVRELPKSAVETLATLKLSNPEDRPTVEVPAVILIELQALAEAVAETRAKQEARGRQKAAEGAQADIEDNGERPSVDAAVEAFTGL